MVIKTCARSSLLIGEQIPLGAQGSAQLPPTASYLLSNPELWLHLLTMYIDHGLMAIPIFVKISSLCRSGSGEGRVKEGIELVGGEEKEERRGRGVNNL